MTKSLREARYAADAFAEQEALPHLARAALLQAYVLANLGDTSSAQDLCHQAWDIAQGQGLLELKYRCDYLLGQIAEHHQDLEAAARYYDRAIKGIDDVQSHLVLNERSSFLEDKGGVYQRAMVLAFKQLNKEQALVYVEKAKSRVLGDYLRNNIDIRLRAADKAGAVVCDRDFERGQSSGRGARTRLHERYAATAQRARVGLIGRQREIGQGVKRHSQIARARTAAPIHDRRRAHHVGSGLTCNVDRLSRRSTRGDDIFDDDHAVAGAGRP